MSKIVTFSNDTKLYDGKSPINNAIHLLIDQIIHFKGRFYHLRSTREIEKIMNYYKPHKKKIISLLQDLSHRIKRNKRPTPASLTGGSSHYLYPEHIHSLDWLIYQINLM